MFSTRSHSSFGKTEVQNGGMNHMSAEANEPVQLFAMRGTAYT